ncbi:MAG TPA: 3-isopropylmalate dehydrogenase, partial [Phenylobacterium sp.]
MAAASEPLKLLVLAGDGIGPEVTDQALRVVDWFAPRLGRPLTITHGLVGGASIDACDTAVSDAVVAEAKAADAVLFGAVGGEQWDARPVGQRPESGIIRLRRDLDVFANLRPAVAYPELMDASALRPELVEGLDIVIVRELTSGVYFGQPRGQETAPNGARRAFDTQAYTDAEIARACRTAFELARGRSGRLCSVDKANVMETGRLWRAVANEVGREYPDVELSHMYADNCAMQLLRRPKQFDVIVTDNLFGDILSDAAAMLTGSLGLAPSASLGLPRPDGRSLGLYEPVHGSAPDIAGQGIANPIAMIASFAMCLRYSFNMVTEADNLEKAIANVL